MICTSITLNMLKQKNDGTLDISLSAMCSQYQGGLESFFISLNQCDLSKPAFCAEKLFQPEIVTKWGDLLSVFGDVIMLCIFGAFLHVIYSILP